jgi:hypothetical protein
MHPLHAGLLTELARTAIDERVRTAAGTRGVPWG